MNMKIDDSQSLERFTTEFVEGKSVNLTTKGEWYYEGVFWRFVSWLFDREDGRICDISELFCKHLDRLEKEVVKFDAAEQPIKDYHAYFTAGSALRDKLNTYGRNWSIKQIQQLDIRLAALHHRIQCEPPEPSDKRYQKLQELAQEWKNSYDNYTDKNLYPVELKKLWDASRYEEYVKLVEKYPSLRDFFFKWILRDNCDVATATSFPAFASELKNAFIACRAGRLAKTLGGEFMKVRKSKKSYLKKKVLTLPMEIEKDGGRCLKHQSIMNGKKNVTFRGGYELTIDQVIEVFRRKNDDAGELEFFGTSGITRWNIQHFNIDMSKENSEWWKDREFPIFEVLTIDEIKERYGVKEIAAGNSLIIAKSDQEFLGKQIESCHGLVDMVVSNGEGDYHLIPIGKLAAWFPTNILEKAFMVANTVEGRISYPDSDAFYSNRRQSSYPVEITEDELRVVMEEIRKDVIRSREGNIIFQFGWENCAYWAQKLLKLIRPDIPDLYLSNALDAEPGVEPLQTVFRVARDWPRILQDMVLCILEFVLLSWRGVTVVENGVKVFKSLATSDFRKNNQMFHPSTLHEKNRDGKGQITFTNNFLPQP